MYKIVLIRHGQTQYNKEKIFCGWTDVDLTEKGIEEARSAGQSLKKENYDFDIAFCSVLKRAIETLSIILDEMGIKDLLINYSWRLNERHYGSLQGQKHEDVARTCSSEQVQKWRRSFCDRPPQLGEDDPRHPCNDPKYCDVDKKDLPSGESLEDTIKRVLPYWHDEIVPAIKNGKKVLISASGNSIRALVKHIENISDSDIVDLEIPNAVPLVYELSTDLKFINKYYINSSNLKS